MHIDKLKMLPFLFLLLLASSCYRTGAAANRELRLADSIMEENPDTAMYVLQRISNPEVMPEPEYAIYCLLITQAADLTNAPHTSDEIISVAVKYFSQSADKQLKAKAHYYMARVQEDLGNTAEAEEHYLLAIAALEKTRDYKQTGNAYNVLSKFYLTIGQHTQSRDAQQMAYNNFLLAAKEEKNLHPVMILFPLCLLVISLLLLARYQIRFHKEKQELKAQAKQLLSARQIIEKQRNELSHLKKEVSSMKIYLFNSLPVVKKIKTFNDIPVNSKAKPALSEQEWTIFLEKLDDTYNFVSNLKHNYHKLTDVDIRICALLRIGVSTVNISLLMGMTPETLSRRIQRIRNDKMNLAKTSRTLELILQG